MSRRRQVRSLALSLTLCQFLSSEHYYRYWGRSLSCLSVAKPTIFLKILAWRTEVTSKLAPTFDMDVLSLFPCIFFDHILWCDSTYFNINKYTRNSYPACLFVFKCDVPSSKSKSFTICFKMETLISYQRDNMLSYSLFVSVLIVSISWCLPTLLIPPISTITYKFFGCIHFIY